MLAGVAITTILSGCGDAPAPTPAPPTPLQQACNEEWRVNLFGANPPADEEVDTPTPEVYAAALSKFIANNRTAFEQDLKDLYRQSHPCWPADFSSSSAPGHYGPFFTRLAWHCSGSYRQDDHTGGCGGGRQRFDPERSWDDNTNLDKAHALLAPLKRKYGHGLSWGDLFVAAGTMALKDMGAPLSRTCFGRIDDNSGSKSTLLGPTTEQELNNPCAVEGNCTRAEGLGTIKIGLIYLNPEGKDMADGTVDPSPALSVIDIRDTFSRMGHSDEGTVALIGGGHAVGKTHGACPLGQGTNPKDTFAANPSESPDMPWMGLCNTHPDSLMGRGHNTFTAGFEGPWTRTPTTWSNDFFTDLKDQNWTLVTGPGGHFQWKVANPTDEEYGRLMRLTSDMALLNDPSYKVVVDKFAANMTAFNQAFDLAWDLLTVVKGFGTWSEEAWCDNADHSDPRFDLDGNAGALTMLDTDIVV